MTDTCIEDFNDNHFAHYFLKLYDMLCTQEEQLEDLPIVFSSGLKNLVESIDGLEYGTEEF